MTALTSEMTSVWRKSTPLPPKRHLVADVHFEHVEDHQQAPVACVCGWRGVVADFADHRKAAT